MKFVTALAVIVMCFVSCNQQQVCDNAKASASAISAVVAGRWSCDKEKVYADIVKPLNSTICKEKKMEKAAWQGYLCKFAINYFVSLGSDKIASRWTCDKAKVQSDLSNVNKLCALF
jgi:hypothetical protein